MVSDAGVEYSVAPRSPNTETLAWTELETELGWASIATSSAAIYALVLSDHSDRQGTGLIQALNGATLVACLLYTSPSPRDGLLSRMPSSA